MKFKIKDISKEFEIKENIKNVIVLESVDKFRKFISSIIDEEFKDNSIFFYEGNDEFKNNKILEYIHDPLSLDFNNTSFLRKVYKYLENNIDNYYKEEVEKLKKDISLFLFNITDNLELEFDINISFNIIKIFEGAQLSIFYENDNIVEKLCKYMDFISQIENKNIFIFNSLRFNLSKEELIKLYEYADILKYSIISVERVLLYDIFSEEELYICDSDFCEIY